MDAVVPFRTRQPGYQRAWRFVQALREIRDAIAPAIAPLGRDLGRLRARGERVIASSAAADARLREAVALARRLEATVAELTALLRLLERY